MLKNILQSNIAIVGGGKFCKTLLQLLYSELFSDQRPRILGVADINSKADGLLYAKEMGIFTTHDYRKIFQLNKLQILIELTKDVELGSLLRKAKPSRIKLIDHVESRGLWSSLQLEVEKRKALRKLRQKKIFTSEIDKLFEEFADHLGEVIEKRNYRYIEIEKELTASERALAQIVQGSTIPTFVINKNHMVTHWNKACEKLTGFCADDIVGTNKQWMPFRAEERPIMADLILDQVKEEDVWKYYGTKWRKSELIKGAYEAEEFFPHLGEEGKWLFFTAAPIKAPDRTIVGAIETLWDKTADKKAQEERERHHKELAASERALAQIVQGSTVPTFVIDKDHRVTHWNRACEKLTEYPAELLVGTNKQWMPFRAEERPIMADLILDQVKEEDVWKYYGTKWHKSALIEGAYEAEEFFPHFGEDGKWLFFTAAPIKASDGTIVGAIETLWDTTADKKAQEALERHHKELAASERALAEIVQGSTIPTFVIDENHIVTHWNKAIEMLSGVLAEEMVGTNRQSIPFWGKVRPSMADVILDQTDAEDIQKLYAGKWRKSALIEGAYEAEAFLPKPGKWCWFTAAPIKAPDGRIIGAIETIWDKTEEKNAEEERQRYTSEIRRRSNFQNKLIRSSNDGIVATDKELSIVIFNPGAERIFGYSADEVIDKINVMDLYPLEMAKAFKNKKLLNNMTRELPWKETLITAKDGTPIPVRFSGRLLYEKKQITGSVAFFQDLREIKRLEMELVKSERLAAIGQTVAGLAHGIKNILHGLKGGSYLVDVGLQKNNTEKLKNGWDMIKRNIGRTSNLVMDLLSYSKEREPEYEPCCPNEIADDVCELLAEKANENKIKILKEFDASIGEVSMDPRTIHEVLLNLMSNAIDACLFDEDTNKKWRVRMKTAREKDHRITFEVVDNGAGMSEEVRQKLFTSFFSTKGHRGTGLGLMVTRKLIEEHQGTVEVESQVGKGTTFTVRLPHKEPDRT